MVKTGFPVGSYYCMSPITGIVFKIIIILTGIVSVFKARREKLIQRRNLFL